MLKDKLKIYNNKEELYSALLENILSIGYKAIEDKGSFTLALSGGRTPCELFDFLVYNYAHEKLWAMTKFFVVDERYLSSDHSDSNSGMMNTRLFEALKIDVNNICHIEMNENAQSSAKKYAEDIRSYFSIESSEIPVFDLILLGLGNDGHTASLFEIDDCIDENGELTRVTSSIRHEHQRISMAMSILINASNVFFLTTGESKAKVLREILNGKNNSCPASVLCEKRESVVFFMDKNVFH